MMANKRNLDCMDSLICSKIPRLENEHNGLSAGLCKPSPLPSYTHENPLKYTGSYLAYHLRNRDGTDLPGVWSQPRPYLQHMGNPTIQSQPSDASHLSSHLYRTEPETLSPAFQSTVNEKDKLDLVKDLMNVRSKWVTFVERQKNLRHGHNLPAVLCSSQVGKHNLIAPTLSTVHNCVNIAFPQPVYRNSVCYSGTGCSLENPVDHFHRRGQETEWRMPPPVTSSCLIASNDHLIHNQQYGNLPPLKNKSLHHGSGHIQVSSVGRITKETGRLPGVRSPLCQGYGTYNRNVLQDPRNSVLSHDNSNGNLPSHINTSIHNLQDFQKVPLHPFATTDGQQMQPPLYCDKLSPPKFPIPIQSKVLHSQNTISNQQNTGTYSSLHPHSYKAPFPGTGGLMPVSSSTFADQLSPGNSYPQPSESLGYPAHPPPSLQKNVSMTVPLIHPALQPVVQPSEFESQSPSRKNMSASLKDPANIKLPSLDMLQFRPRVIVDAQTDERCYNSLNSLYNKEYVGQQQLISKHSAFHPVLSGKHLKGTFERPVGSPADQRPKDIYMQEHMPSIHISSNGDHGRSTFSKESENINNKPVEGRLESPPKSYSISPTRKISEMNSSPASKEDKRATPPASPPMPVINNVFSLAPYKAYLEATGLFFSKCLKCQSDCDESLICSCSSENKTKNCRYGVIDLDLNNSSIRLSKAINELQSKNAELEKNNPSVCIESTNEKGSSGKNELNKTVSEKISLDIQHRDISLSPNHSRLRNDAHQQSSNCNTNCAVNHVDEKLGMNKMQVDTALDLSIKNKNQLVDVTQQPLSVSCGIREELKTTKEILNEKEENTTKSVSSTEKHESKGPSGKHGEKTIITASETSNLSNYHRTELNKKYKILRPAPLKVGEMNPIQPSEGINETNKFSLIGSVDPSTFILRPLKLTLPDVPKSTLSPVLDAKKLLCETKVGMPSNEELMQCEKPLKLTLPDVPKSTLSPVPEAKKPLCETKVSVPGNVELMPSESGTYAYFVRLHQSLCGMIAQSVAETSEEVLRVCLQDIEVQNDGKENPKLRSSLKSKNGTRNFEVLKMSKSKEIWLSYGQVQPTMQKLLSHLETYLFITRCPFPHVIRAGAIFIPICLVKEKLFSSLKGAMIDQVFQQHKIELRPTTLSEEKKLQSELKLQRCSSRLIKLLSLKQLPEIYTDLLNVLWHSCVKIRLETQCRHEDLPGLFSHSQLRYKAICRALDMPIPAPDDDFYHTSVQNDENMKKVTITLNPADRNDQNQQRHKNKTVANTSSSEEKPNNGIAVAKLDVKLRKRRRKKKSTSSSLNSDPLRTNSSGSSQSVHKVKPSSVVHSEKASCTEPDQDASTVHSGQVSQPGPRKLQKSTNGLLEEKAFRKGHFEKNGSTLVVRLNRVAVSEDDKGSVSHTVKIKKSLIPIKRKKNNGALRPTRSTSKVLHLRGSIVRLKFQKPVQTAPCRNIVLKPIITTRKPLLIHTSQRLAQKKTKPLPLRRRQRKEYPNLVGKRIRHLYEENDKTESWYKGVVVRVHEKHQNPLETVYEVKYDTEPDWQYYLELLQDYEKGWLRIDD